jgi:hypothetical protein
VDKAEKRRKRMESAGMKTTDADADSELSDDKEGSEEEGEEGAGAEKGKKEEKVKEHKPIKKTDDEIKKA